MDHQQSGRKQAVNSPDVAMANKLFDQFCSATTLKTILGYFRQLCELLKIRPNTINQFYPKLKAKLRSWKAQPLWKKFDQRANHECYNRGKACPNTRVLIIGGGPCGLRSAIEAQLLGAKVVVVEKRDRMSRNNVLHLWPFVIQDLRGLGAKKFFGKFCAGSIDHISIRQLQCILLKVALILGVEFHESVSFDALIPPPENQEEGKIGWRAKTTPADHPVAQYEFDVLIGADGKRNTLEGFKRKEFRGKLAIAITANFINKRTEAEARVEEISGVAFIFNQKFFKELYQETGIDLENIVYYKDDTHYFVMTAKKHSLIDKGVILQDHADTAKLLAKENVDREALMIYAREAAEFSTEYQMMDMEFAVNHYGQPDVAMFDFTSMYAAENASRLLERRGHRLLMILVGDSLLEPFWPTGSGCARGFLSSLDACWAIKGWGASVSPLEVIAERESIYRLLGQTTPENLNRDYAAYTLDPHTRYPNLNVSSVTPIQVRSQIDTDDPESIKHPPILTDVDIPKKRRRRDLRGDSQVHPDMLLRWLQKQVALYDSVRIEDMGTSFKNGLAICAIIHRYRPDLIDFHSMQPEDAATNNQLAFDILEKELGIPPIMTGEEMAQCDVPDKLAMFSYLTQIYDVFRGEIPYIKHPKLEPENEERPAHSKQLSQLTPDQKVQLIDRIVRQDSATRTRHSRSRHNENLSPADKKGDTISRRSRKRRSTEKMGATVEERQKRLAEIEQNRVERMRRRQYMRKMATQQFYKSMQMLQANAKREKDEPFEDYSIFLYRQTAPDFKDRVKYLEQKILYPDREPKIHAGHRRNSIDEEFSGRIKSIEDKLKGSAPSEKKPRDLLRAIGKIEKTDWNVKEIEKKIEESKMGRSVRHEKVERVPKWSREQFLARQIKMEKKGRDQKDTDSKYADIDNTLKNIDRKIKEGNVLGYNKVSAMAEQFSNKNQDAEPRVRKSNAKPTITLPAQGGSEMCHFCNKRVYLMERLSAEGKFFHRGCFRCEYCSTSLRIGNHTFDREKNGGRFYCTQHFGFPGTIKARAEKKRITLLNKENIPNSPVNVKAAEKAKLPLEGVVGLDLLDRVQTPERIEFENLAGMSDAEEPQSQMDEDEWTDRNFGASTAEMGSSDDISDMSDSDEDNEVYEEAIDQPLTTEGTLELAKNWTLRYSHPHAAMGQSDTGSNEYEDSSDEYTNEDDDSTTATEDEEHIRARELRKQEVWLKHPTRSSDTDTGSETEVKISQDSVDKVTQDSPIPPESDSVQTSNLVSPQMANTTSDTLIEDIIGSNDVQNSLNTQTEKSDLSVVDTDQQVGNNENVSIEQITSPNEACGSIISVPDFSVDLISDATENNAVNSNTPLVSSSNIAPENVLNKDINMEEYISEYESVIEENALPISSKIPEISNESLVENKYITSISKDNNVSCNELNHTIVPVTDEPSKVNFVDDDSSQKIPLNSKLNNKINTVLNTTTSETSNILNAQLQTEFAGIMLPDAIPISETSYDNRMQSNTEEITSFKETLPDLITSSPNHSRESSPSSSSEIYKSTETLYDELSTSDAQDKHQELESDASGKKEGKLKVSIRKAYEQIPIVTITSPSPTNERPSDKASLEVTKLTVPKQGSHKPVQSDGNSSFDKLKRDLRQRKAKNRIPVAELRPLSTENARKKMSKYFKEEKKQKTNPQKVSVDNKSSPDIEIIELNIKPKLSTKVEAKDIAKYFCKTKLEPSEILKTTTDDEETGAEFDVNVNTDELNAIIDNDTDTVNLQFDEVDIEDTGSTLLFSTPSTELHLVNVDLQDVATNVNIVEHELSPKMSDVEVPVFDTNFVHEEDINVSPDISEMKLHQENVNISNDSLDTKSQEENTILNEKSLNTGLNRESIKESNDGLEVKSLAEDVNISDNNLHTKLNEKGVVVSNVPETKPYEGNINIKSSTVETKLNKAPVNASINISETKPYEENTNTNNTVETKLNEEPINASINISETQPYEENANMSSSTIEAKLNQEHVNTSNNILETIPHKDDTNVSCNSLETKLETANTNLSNNSLENKLHENIEINAEPTALTSRLVKVKVTDIKNNALHASDSTLNVRRGIGNTTDTLYKNSVSSCELRNLPAEHEPIARVTVVEQNIQTPLQVANVSITNSISSSTLNDTPKRPERRHGQHELNSSAKSNISSAQSVPEIPTRRKSSRSKSNILLSSEKSTTVMQPTSATNERLTVANIATDKHQTQNIENNDLKYSVEPASSETGNTPNVLKDTPIEQKHSHPTKSLLSDKTDQCESLKSVASKSDRSKKDKCIIS